MISSELLQAAEAGDITAINTIGSSFFEEEKFTDAARWYERSANLGDSFGKQMAFSLWGLLGSACESNGYYDDALARWRGSYQMALKVIADTNLTNAERDVALAKRAEILCGIGANLYVLGRKEEALEPLSLAAEEGSLMAKVVLGMYYATTATNLTVVESYRQAIPLLETLFNTNFTYEKKSQLDRSIVYVAYSQLATAYRTGLGGMVPSIERAHTCMLHLQNQDLHDFSGEITVELKKYRKKLLGGYAYIG